MKIEQIYTGCIAQAAYYIESNGEAAIFDPLREVQPYLDRAQRDNAKIKYIFETHFHADFVSGHLDLSEKSGAQIVFGPTAKTAFKSTIAEDNQVFTIGNYTVKVIHTPGHTLESSCYLLINENGIEKGIITGDTLFIGDVGRPDLAQTLEQDLTQEKLAGLLFDSLRNKIMPLSDDIMVYPSHGAGSACGKNMSKETTDTLGNQKKVNYALGASMTKEEFIKELLDGLGLPPAYFPQNVMLNSKGYESLDKVLLKSNTGLSITEFMAISQQDDCIILDVRHENEFVKEHIPNSIFIGIEGSFAPWVGSLLRDVDQKLLLVTPIGKEEETITRLSRVGFDNVQGYLKEGLDSWKKAGYETSSITSIKPEEFEDRLTANSIVIDARKPGEFQAEHVENANNIPLDTINEMFESIPRNEAFFLHCAGGYRSVIMASILKSRGIHHIINIEKGFNGIKQTKVICTKFVCPSTLT